MARRRAPQGTGSVGYDRTRGTWYARIYSRDANGKRVSHKARAATPELAEQERKRLVARYGSDEGDEPTGTLGEYLDGWYPVHARSIRASTADSYRVHVERHIKPLLGGIPVHRLRPRDVDRLVTDRLAAGLHPATVRNIVTTLRIALNRAVRRRLILDNPASHAEMPKVETRLVEPLTEARLERVMEAVAGHWLEPVLTVIAGSGIRVGEAVGLDWGDVHEDGDQPYVVVRRTKTRPRAVPISDDAAEALRKLRAARPVVSDTAPVFRSPRPGPRQPDGRANPEGIAHAMHELLEREGLPPLTPHGLRHGVATRMVAEGVHMRVVADQLGHRDPALTARVYAHVLPQSQRDAVRLLNRKRTGT